MDATILADRSEVRTGSVDRTFEGRDTKGRTLGASAYLFTATYTEKGPDASWGYRIQADTVNAPRYGFHMKAKRNGEGFGAYHRPQEFLTEAERDAAVVKYLAQAEKRAAKLAA